MSPGLTSPPMTEKERRSNAVRLSFEAVEAAKIAAAFKGQTVADYVSAVVLEAANRDIEEGYRARSRGGTPPPPPPKPAPKKGGGK